MKNLLLIIVIIPLITLCSPKGDIEEQILQINTSSDISDEDLSSKFKLKEIIVLDTVKSSYLNPNKINSIIFADNKIIVSEYEAPTINFFDRKSGKLIETINKFGRGAGEYSHKKRYILLSDDKLAVESISGNLNYYNLQGDYLSQTPEPVALNSMNEYVLTKDNNILISKELVGLYSHKDNSKPYYSAALISPSNEILKESIERPTTSPKLLIKSVISRFYKYDDDNIYLSPITQNTIYKYSYRDSTFKAEYKLIVNGEDVDELLKNNNLNHFEFQNMRSTQYITSITPRYIILGLSYPKKGLYNLLINKKSSQFELVEVDNSKDIHFGRFIQNNIKKLVQIVSYSDLIDDDDKVIDSELTELIKEKGNINENMNLVICIYDEI